MKSKYNIQASIVAYSTDENGKVPSPEMRDVLRATPTWVARSDTQQDIIRMMFYQVLAVVAKYESDVINPKITFEEEFARLRKKYLNE